MIASSAVSGRIVPSSMMKASALRAHRFEGRRLRSTRPNQDWFDLHADAARALAELRNEGQTERIEPLATTATRRTHGTSSRISSKYFARSLDGRTRHASDVSARPGKAGDQAGCNRIAGRAITIGMSLVACLAACTAGVRAAMITSALR